MKCSDFIIMQGDAYKLVLGISINKQPIDLNKVEKIQFVVGDLTKYYNKTPTSEVEYDEDYQAFLFPISEDESFKFEGDTLVQCRVLFTAGQIVGSKYGYLPLHFNEIKEEMTNEKA